MTDIEHVPIFHPTIEQLENFEEYVDTIEPQCKGYGGCKIVAPSTWRARKGSYDDFGNTLVRDPVEQLVEGTGGVYQVVLLVKKSRTPVVFKEYARKNDVYDKQTDQQMEKLFWRTLKFNSPMYGADSAGSLFDDDIRPNCNHLDSVLTRGLAQKLPGINTPYLYFGSWKSLFAWHREDLDLYALNYLHSGMPKHWYIIPADESEKLEKFVARYYEDEFKQCKQFMRHKTTLVHPNTLKKHGITVHKVVQRQNEFVITFPAAYHAGFNFGSNIAEAVNFATKSWIEVGKAALPCRCKPDTVKMDFDIFLENLRIYDEAVKIRASGEHMALEHDRHNDSASTKSGDDDEEEEKSCLKIKAPKDALARTLEPARRSVPKGKKGTTKKSSSKSPSASRKSALSGVKRMKGMTTPTSKSKAVGSDNKKKQKVEDEDSIALNRPKRRTNSTFARS
eukprot:CAMPEP_0115029436 /NCGR_PEP_ID=MMETSP0216-20121206/36998_1 /TAXON_ID=223996 /ORGANISM="Protocruzia adherens, Strain Boccale" /LENGTH=449 /DNA_ID=CAMNT_0002406017 /DNA_START=67 /DNA_END=1416 /DNA_ORIENTATION=-